MKTYVMLVEGSDVYDIAKEANRIPHMPSKNTIFFEGESIHIDHVISISPPFDTDRGTVGAYVVFGGR